MTQMVFPFLTLGYTLVWTVQEKTVQIFTSCDPVYEH